MSEETTVSGIACPVIGDGILDTPEELMHKEYNVSAYDGSFWDLWIQKLFRNFASMKFQLLMIVYVPVVYGMFHMRPGTEDPWISSELGLGFLGGGYIALAAGRIIANTSLMSRKEDSDLNTDK